MRLVGILLIASLAACGSTTSRTPRVGRERLLVTQDPRLDPYFLAVYGHQMALADVDGRRAELSAALSRALDLRQNADRATLSAAIRAALDRARVRRVRVRIEPAPDVDDRVNAWQAALSAQSPRGPAEEIAARYAAVTESVTVTLTPVAATAENAPDGGLGPGAAVADGGPADAAPETSSPADASPAEPSTAGSAATGVAERTPATSPELAPALEAIAAILRDAEATRRCMARLVGQTPEVFTTGADLRARAPAQWWPEFAAAERFVLGMHARATLHEQEAVRAQRWALGALRPESEAEAGGPDDEDQSPPESGP
ncbi:MAG: hypothetical protein U0324_02035 [Polyangiales bacterium]